MKVLSVRWLSTLLPLALLVAWWLFDLYDPVAVPLLVSPQTVVEGLWIILASGDLLTDLLASLRRFLVGLLCGGLAGLALGAWLAFSQLADELLSPTFHTLKHIALFAWIPLLSLWLGMGETAKIAFISLAAFTPLVINAYEGFRSIPSIWRDVTSVMRLTPSQNLRWLWLPAAGPSLFAGLHLAVIYAWLATVGAEYFFVAGPGLAHILIDGREHMRMDWVAIGVLLIGGTGATLSTVSRWIEGIFLKWHRSSTSSHDGV